MFKKLNFVTKTSLLLLGITFILSIFNIGPSTKPIYFYLNDINTITMISTGCLLLSLLLIARLITIYLNKKEMSVNKLGMNLILINLMIDIVCGGNSIFFIAYTITFILLLINHIRTKKANS